MTLASRTGRRPRRGIIVHRSTTLTAPDRTTRSSIPATSLARTLTDLRRAVAPEEYRKALREAELRGYEAPERLPTRSELEDLFLALCRRHRLPPPEINVRVEPFIVDFLWREAKLVVETDGYAFHRGRQAFETDRSRDLELRLLGYEVIRVSYMQVREQPTEIAAAIRAALASEMRLPGA